MRSRFACLCGVLAMGTAAPVFAQPNAADYAGTPVFTETFAGGATVGLWDLDPGNLSGAAAPTFVTATPGSIAASFVTANPVGSSADGGVMMMGNASSTAGTLFGLNYVRCTNSLAAGTGTDFTTLTEYRVVASLWLPTDAQLGGSGVRYQVGPYVFGGDLFRSSSWYNNGSTGGGPGFAYRGMQQSQTIFGPGNISTGRWTKLSVMVKDSGTAGVTNAAVCVDTNGDGTLNEADPLEYVGGLTIDSATRTPGTFGIFTVGDVSNDIFPLFVDTVELYLPAGSAESDWHLYD